MEFLRTLLAFFFRNLDVIAIVLLSISIIKLNIDVNMQKEEIKDLQTEIELIKNQD